MGDVQGNLLKISRDILIFLSYVSFIHFFGRNSLADGENVFCFI